VQKELALSEISKAGEKCVRLFETILGLTPDFSWIPQKRMAFENK